MNPDITIKTDVDWKKLRAEKMNAILDPMIVRSADLWLRGRKGQTDEKAPEVWAALDKNIDSLEAFFDAFILSERLPLVDYWTTYDSNIGFEPASLYQRINQAAGESVLRNVHVCGKASETARKDSLERLKIAKPLRTEKALIATVKQEFSAFDHQWRPRLGELGPLSDDQQLIARFQYGLVLFGYFSAKAKVGHVVQSKRARVFASGALHAPSADYELQGELQRELKEVIESEGKKAGRVLEVPVCPPFLSYLLLQQPKNTRELFQAALKLRGQQDIKAYRDWRSKIVAQWQRYGQIDHETEADFRKAVRGALRELGVAAPEPDKSSGTQVGVNLLFMTLNAAPEKLFGWIPGLGAGKRHVKVLMRTMRAAHEQKKLTDAVRYLWSES
jgi:hypothetical protein